MSALLHDPALGATEHSKVLVVDDDPDIRGLLNLRLKASGYEVALAGDAIAAVNIARKEHPDVIVLDLMLPAGDGYLVMERFQAMPALEGVPVIIVSARDPLLEQERTKAAHVHSYCHKPFDFSELLAGIQTALGDSPETKDTSDS